MSALRARLQGTLLSAYKSANRMGLLDLPGAATVFQRSYFAYKRFIEDPFARLVKTRRELFLGGDIIDVGANIGYTAALFARVVASPYHVHAFEPEERNFRWLEQTLDRCKLASRVIAHRAAVGAHEGEIELWRNTAHHGDHRVATERLRATTPGATERVPLTTIDAHVARRNWSPVSFVKIDVQGYEPEVLRGMHDTIARNANVHVAIEFMPSAIVALGFDAAAFVRDIEAVLPRIAILGHDGSLRAAVGYDAIMTEVEHRLGYVDLVCAR